MNNIRAVMNTSAPSLVDKGTKTIEDLKRQMVIMEEENIKVFNEEKLMSNKNSKKPSKIGNIWRLCFK